ncbi:MAG TPA: LptF/LptG family permease [Rhodothermales bacterium]|nr:LptF/LptG family permease [Rhodothermales bacterium]
MKRLHRQILRMLPGPFLGCLALLMFLLLMQFLIKYLPDIVGKGLPAGVIAELIAYNLAYMLVLAVPMSVLLASLFTFGRLAETNSYLVIKSSGISLAQLVWPTLVVSAVLAGGMWYFNSDILPEANFRARNLWQDIQRKRPDFELQPGVFYDGLNGYSILVQHIQPGTSLLQDVLVYDYTDGSQHRAEIKAKRGRIKPVEKSLLIDLILEDGEIHRLDPHYGLANVERYERLSFQRFRLRLDLSDFIFERTDPTEGYRSDRTMRSSDMILIVDSVEAEMRAEKARVREMANALLSDSAGRRADVIRPAAIPDRPPGDFTFDSESPILAGLDSSQQQEVFVNAIEDVRQMKNALDESNRTLRWDMQRADRYRVEIHKKRSIALACIIFMLIGAPLGLTSRRGSLGRAGALAMCIFMFYWVTLVQGEKLADRDLLAPWVGMWLANIVMTVVGLWLVVYIMMDLGATAPLHKRLREWIGATAADEETRGQGG